MNVALGLKLSKPEKHETLKQVLKKWLLIWGSKSILVKGPLLIEKTIEIANKLNIKSFQDLKGKLEK